MSQDKFIWQDGDVQISRRAAGRKRLAVPPHEGYRKGLDPQGGPEPAVGRDQLEGADFVTLPERVPGTNCANCKFFNRDFCGFSGELNGRQVDLRGQPVNDRTCCGAWDNPDALRTWQAKAWSGARYVHPGVAKRAGPHKFASTQFNLAEAGYPKSQGSPVPVLEEMALSIPDEDLEDDGREDEPHVTVKYGLHTASPEDVRRLVEGFGYVTLRLGKTSIFPARETDAQRGGEQFDVVKVDVDSPGLHRLNALLADNLPHTDTHPEYRPHVTLAYVKPGRGEQYVGMDDVDGMEVLCGRLVFSDPEGVRTVIPLTRQGGGGRRAKAQGAPCSSGETAAQTGCKPAEGSGSGEPAQQRGAVSGLYEVGSNRRLPRLEENDIPSALKEQADRIKSDPDSMKAVENYTRNKTPDGEPIHKVLNAAARGLVPMPDNLKPLVERLDGLTRQTLPSPTAVYCALGERGNEFLEKCKRAAAEGVELEDLGFGSTSLDPHAARTFADPGHRVLTQIVAKQGAYLAPVSSYDEGEQELLLPRGSRFRVLGFDENVMIRAMGFTVIRLEQV
jgi:hypothetical protein